MKWGSLDIQRVPWWIVVAAVVVLYFGFHRVRGHLPDSLFRDSFPSFLAIVLLFSIVELQSDIRFHSRRMKFWILLLTTTGAAIWFEGIVPLFYRRSTGDIKDVYAMLGGFAVYWVLQSIPYYFGATSRFDN